MTAAAGSREASLTLRPGITKFGCYGILCEKKFPKKKHDFLLNQATMIIASHTMPGPSPDEINTAGLLIVLGPVLVSCLLTALLTPCGSLVRRSLAAVVGIVVGTMMLTLATALAMISAVVFVRIAGDVASWVIVAAGVLLLAIFGVFCLAMSVRVTQTMCRNWRGDLTAANAGESRDRLLARSWAAGLLMGLSVAAATNTVVPIGIGAMGGTLIAAGLILCKRPRQHLLPEETTISNQQQSN